MQIDYTINVHLHNYVSHQNDVGIKGYYTYIVLISVPRDSVQDLSKYQSNKCSLPSLNECISYISNNTSKISCSVKGRQGLSVLDSVHPDTFDNYVVNLTISV